MIWQMIQDGRWIFGEPIRGAIRKPLAMICIDDSSADPWSWHVFIPNDQGEMWSTGHSSPDFCEAVDMAEDVMRLYDRI